MTPKEKADELIVRFGYVENIDDIIVRHGNKRAVMCALICVDEIIQTKPLEKDYEDHGRGGVEIWYNDMTDYWKQVKLEIEKL